MKNYDVTFEEKNIWQITLKVKNEENAFEACGLWEENWEASE